VTTRFDRDTALTPLKNGEFEGHVDRAWWIQRGPNGGYVAAIVLRALTMAVDDADRAPRSLTIHYTAPPAEGLVRVSTVVERQGRSLTTVSGRLHQDGRLLALAMAAFSRPRPGVEFHDAVMPDVPSPDESAPWVRTEAPPPPPIVHQYDMRPVVQEPFLSGAREAVAGGWIRLAEPRSVDALLAAALTDAWVPAVFARLTAPVGVPTVDLTVHFRSALPSPDAQPDDFILAMFRTRVAAEGFLEEDGELWSRDGRLIAQSRQLAAMLAQPSATS
jgi:acyl-CoA thioesterase